jgi:sulfur carrier protein ThiS
MTKMSKLPLISKLCVLPLLLFFLGCAASRPNAVEAPPTLMQMNIKPNGFIKKIAVFTIGSPQSHLDSQMQALYNRVLIGSIRAETKNLQLITAENPELAEFISSLQLRTSVIDQAALAKWARSEGYQAVLITRFPHLELIEKKTGALWFRKNGYFIEYGILLNMYDPSTGAKLISTVIEKATKIPQQEYESLRDGSRINANDFDETITDLAEELGEKVADVLNKNQWRSSVVAVEADRVFLPAHKDTGIAAGDRLAVFKTQMMEQTHDGSQFLLPKQKVAELRVVAVGDKLTEAVGEPSAGIRKGDLVVPLND